MRIVDRATFLALPAGTVYAKYQPQICESISIKQSCVGDNDWTYTPLDTISFIDSEDDGDLSDKLDGMEAGDEVKTEMYISYRDGLFNKNDRFMIYDQTDTKNLIELLTQTL